MSSQRAFTLIEMLFSLALIAIVMAMTLPSMRDFYQQTQTDVLRSELIHSLEFAKREANLRRVAVSMCHSNDQATCSGTWQEGWIIFVDANQRGNPEQHQLLRVYQARNAGGVLHHRAYPFYREHLSFKPDDIETHDDGTFWYCPADQEFPVWAIFMSKYGRNRSVYPNENHVINTASGKPLVCSESM